MRTCWLSCRPCSRRDGWTEGGREGGGCTESVWGCWRAIGAAMRVELSEALVRLS